MSTYGSRQFEVYSSIIESARHADPSKNNLKIQKQDQQVFCEVAPDGLQTSNPCIQNSLPIPGIIWILKESKV